MQVNNPDDASIDEETPHYTQPKQPGQKDGGKRRWMIIGVILVVLVAGAVAYWLLKPQPAAKPKQTSQPATQENQNMPAPAPAGSSSGTTTYTASGSDLSFTFDYPSGWTADPPSGSDTTDQPITISSPLVSLTGADGSAVTGKVVVTIRPAAAEVTELETGSPVAAQDSVQFAYTAPTKNQHQYPYLTFIHFTTGQNAPGAFEEVMITGIQKLKKGQAVTAVAPDPIITANFYSCTTDACTGTGAKPLSLNNTIWQSDATAKQVQDLFASFQFH